MNLEIPIWQALLEDGTTVSCNTFSLQSAAVAIRALSISGKNVAGLTDGELVIKGRFLDMLLADPNAIHMHNSKLYDSSAELTLK